MKFAMWLLLAALSAAPAWSAPLLTLLPSGNISGLPGSTIGWGFIITNDSGYIEITSAQFCLNPVSFPACTAPAQGTFADLISMFNDIVVGPAGSVSQAFDPILFKGVGSFAISPGAVPPANDSGQIVLTYALFDADPNGVGPVNQLASDQLLVANASVLVTDTAATPEPESWMLIGAGLLALLGHRSLTQRQKRLD